VTQEAGSTSAMYTRRRKYALECCRDTQVLGSRSCWLPQHWNSMMPVAMGNAHAGEPRSVLVETQDPLQSPVPLSQEPLWAHQTMHDNLRQGLYLSTTVHSHKYHPMATMFWSVLNHGGQDRLEECSTGRPQVVGTAALWNVCT
jgi:hypothetical protein